MLRLQAERALQSKLVYRRFRGKGVDCVAIAVGGKGPSHWPRL